MSEPQGATDRTLTELIDLATLQAMQDRFAALTHVATSIRRPDGECVTVATGESEFCRMLMAGATSGPACRRSHALASSSVAGAEQPRQFECHAGLTQLAAPIMAGRRHVGTILMGDRPRSPLSEDSIRRLASEYGLPLDELRRAAWGLRPWADADMKAAADFLHFLANALARHCYQEVELRDRVDELTALYRLGSMAAGTDDVQAIMDGSLRTVVEVLLIKAASIRLLDAATGELKIAAVHNLSPEYLNKGAVVLSQSPIDAEAVRNGIVYVANQPEDPRTLYPAEARREGIVSALVAAMTYRGRTIGVMRVYSGQPRVFSAFEHSLLKAMASQIAAAIIHAQLRNEALAAERLKRQIELAADVQRRMIPAAPPRHPHVDLGAVYYASLTLSGDFYDFIELPKGNLGIAVADVVGKGIPASLTMASVRAALRAHARSIYDIDRIAGEVNRDICRDSTISEFVTLFYGVLSPDGRRFTYCNAGHEPPLLLRDGQVTRLGAGGNVLGIDPEATFERGILHLKANDVLLIFTDGLIEGISFDGEIYGRERLAASLVRHGGAAAEHLTAQHLATQIHWDLRRFRGLAEQSDDITIVALRVRPGSGGA